MIGLKWAKSVLINGYQKDNRKPMETTIMVMNKDTGFMEKHVLTQENCKERTLDFCMRTRIPKNGARRHSRQ